MCKEAGAVNPARLGNSVKWIPKAVCCFAAMLQQLVADFVSSLSETYELCVDPVFDDIPSQDAANTVANYS